MKKFLMIGVGLLIGASTLVLFAIKQERANEGNNSWEAVRNYLFRDGQIKVTVAPGSTIETASCNRTPLAEIHNNNVVFKLGYVSNVDIKIRSKRANGTFESFSIYTDKLNNWDRVLFIQDDTGQFRKIDNGIEQTGGFIVAHDNTEQGAAANP